MTSIQFSEGFLSWADLETLKFYAFAQRGRFHSTFKSASEMSSAEFISAYQASVNSDLRFIRNLGLLGKLQSSSSILEVGAGVGTLTCLLAKKLRNSTHFMVDKTSLERTDKVQFHGTEHAFYNSWNVIHDAIKTSGLDPHRFHTLDPADDWPQVDVIISKFAWCWHIPLEVYFDRMLRSLKIGGILVLDVLNTQSNSTDKISSALGSTKLSLPYVFNPSHRFAADMLVKNNSHGSINLWVRVK